MCWRVAPWMSLYSIKRFLVSRNELREIENIDARDLDLLIASFLLQVHEVLSNLR